MNTFERQVIAAARSFHNTGSNGALYDLDFAVGALDAHEAQQAPTVRTVPWHEVAVGDHLQGADGVTYRPVIKTLRVTGGKYEITVQLASGPKTLRRPTAEAQDAVVRRGADGAAVDVFVNVFSSGGLT